MFRQQSAAGGVEPELQGLMAELDATRPKTRGQKVRMIQSKKHRAKTKARRGRPEGGREIVRRGRSISWRTSSNQPIRRRAARWC